MTTGRKTASFRQGLWSALAILCLALGCSDRKGDEQTIGTAIAERRATETLQEGRAYHTATPLPNGDVLVAGGLGGGPKAGALASTEVFSASRNGFVALGAMGQARISHTATLLPNGRVLLAGGSSGRSDPTPSAELYDHATGAFIAAGTMAAARSGHTATLLPSGKVLVAGGDETGQAELYDPAGNRFTPTGTMVAKRAGHTATLLSNGKVLLVGGCAERIAELYDPASGRFTATGSTGADHFNSHSATLLPRDRVLILGGGGGWRDGDATAEIYDPSTGRFTPTTAMGVKRTAHTATSLPGGRVLVAGGCKDRNIGTIVKAQPTPSIVEIYDPASGRFSVKGALDVDRNQCSATRLADGRVVLIGGIDGWVMLPTVEIFSAEGLGAR